MAIQILLDMRGTPAWFLLFLDSATQPWTDRGIILKEE
jgi:hypothetical protein